MNKAKPFTTIDISTDKEHKDISDIALISVVNDLNDEMFEHDSNSWPRWSFSTDGYAKMICFDNEIMWTSEFDDRRFDHTVSDDAEIMYEESIKQHVKRKFNEYVDALVHHRYKDVISLESIKSKIANEIKDYYLQSK